MEQVAVDAPIAEGLVPDRAGQSGRALKTALEAAWLAVFLGLTVQALIVIAKLLAGGTQSPLAFAASVGQGITWSVLVCGGVAIGSVARVKSLAMGLLGLVSGPLAWGLAKGVQKALQALMGLPVDKVDSFFYLITSIKGAEYAVLGAALGFLAGRARTRLATFAGTGLATGLVFGTIAIALNLNHAKMQLPALVGLGVNELVFPVGCSLVIYAVHRLRNHVGKVA